MTNFFTSDLHLGHQRVIELCNRPFASVDEMNEKIVENWNETVDDNDSVYILGDLALGTIKESIQFVTKLKGNKILVPGNHDRVWSGYPQKAAKGEEMRRLYESVGLTIAPQECQFVTTGGKEAWRLCHFPTSGDNYTDDRYPEHRPKLNDGEWLIHGHVHTLWQVNGRQINVGVDVWDFRPISEATLRVVMNKAEWFEEK